MTSQLADCDLRKRPVALPLVDVFQVTFCGITVNILRLQMTCCGITVCSLYFQLMDIVSNLADCVFVVVFVDFLCSGFRSPLSYLLCFITLILIMYVSL